MKHHFLLSITAIIIVLVTTQATTTAARFVCIGNNGNGYSLEAQSDDSVLARDATTGSTPVCSSSDEWWEQSAVQSIIGQTDYYCFKNLMYNKYLAVGAQQALVLSSNCGSQYSYSLFADPSDLTSALLTTAQYQSPLKALLFSSGALSWSSTTGSPIAMYDVTFACIKNTYLTSNPFLTLRFPGSNTAPGAQRTFMIDSQATSCTASAGVVFMFILGHVKHLYAAAWMEFKSDSTVAIADLPAAGAANHVAWWNNKDIRFYNSLFSAGNSFYSQATTPRYLAMSSSSPYTISTSTSSGDTTSLKKQWSVTSLSTAPSSFYAGLTAETRTFDKYDPEASEIFNSTTCVAANCGYPNTWCAGNAWIAPRCYTGSFYLVQVLGAGWCAQSCYQIWPPSGATSCAFMKPVCSGTTFSTQYSCGCMLPWVKLTKGICTASDAQANCDACTRKGDNCRWCESGSSGSCIDETTSSSCSNSAVSSCPCSSFDSHGCDTCVNAKTSCYWCSSDSKCQSSSSCTNGNSISYSCPTPAPPTPAPPPPPPPIGPAQTPAPSSGNNGGAAAGNDDDGGSSTGPIIGGVVGGIVVVLAVVGLVFYMRARRLRQNLTTSSSSSSSMQEKQQVFVPRVDAADEEAIMLAGVQHQEQQQPASAVMSHEMSPAERESDI